MKIFSKISLCLFVLAFSSIASANDLKFKSSSLNQVVSIFKSYSPELVETGSVEVAYCGAYGANFGLKKEEAKTLASSYAIRSTLGMPNDVLDYRALELEDVQVDEMLTKIYKATFDIRYGTLFHVKTVAGVPYLFDLTAIVMSDDETNEYLVMYSDVWQDDCD